MPIHEGILDGLAHVMGHYFADTPEAGDVDADELAAYMEACGVCAHCLAAFVHDTGAHDLAEAIAVVWESEVWQAFEAHLREAGGDDDGVCR
jgi:hypothetical protein